MEIERKFLIRQMPENWQALPHHEIEQAYLCTNPVVRIRRQDASYYLTYKGKGKMAREEYNLPLTPEGYAHLLKKADDHVIRKTRYLIPMETETNSQKLIGEIDIFHDQLEGLVFMEIEFSSIEEALAYQPPAWVGEDVTENPFYHNSRLSKLDSLPR